MHRIFVAIRFPQDIRDLLVDAIDDSAELRWVPEDQLHLTLRFIGEVERPVAEEIASHLGRVRAEAFTLAIRGLGRFDQRSGGTLWAGVEPKAPVAALAAKIDRACVAAGLEPERRAFHPHITLARFGRSSAGAAADFLQRNAALASDAFPVSSFALIESHLSRHGAHHEEVASYALRESESAPSKGG